MLQNKLLSASDALGTDALLSKARVARGKGLWKDAYRCYSVVAELEPQCLEALFYAPYSRLVISLNEYALASDRRDSFDELSGALRTILSWYNTQLFRKSKALIKEMSTDIFKLLNQSYTYYQASPLESVSSTGQMLVLLDLSFVSFLEELLKNDEQAYLYKLLIAHYKRCIESVWVPNYLKAKFLKNMDSLKKFK